MASSKDLTDADIKLFKIGAIMVSLGFLILVISELIIKGPIYLGGK
jgi:hypothetical protein